MGRCPPPPPTPASAAQDRGNFSPPPADKNSLPWLKLDDSTGRRRSREGGGVRSIIGGSSEPFTNDRSTDDELGTDTNQHFFRSHLYLPEIFHSITRCRLSVWYARASAGLLFFFRCLACSLDGHKFSAGRLKKTDLFFYACAIKRYTQTHSSRREKSNSHFQETHFDVIPFASVQK